MHKNYVTGSGSGQLLMWILHTVLLVKQTQCKMHIKLSVVL